MYANLSLGHELLKEVLKERVLSPTQWRQAVGWLMEEHAVSERRACRVLGQVRATQRRCRRERGCRDAAAKARLLALALQHRRWGCGQLHGQLRFEGHRINHKRPARLYREHGLALRWRRRRRLPWDARKPLLQLGRTGVGRWT